MLIDVTLFGIVTSVIWLLLNPLKYFNWLGFSSVFSIVNFDIWLPLNALSSIVITLDGITISVNLLVLNAASLIFLTESSKVSFAIDFWSKILDGIDSIPIIKLFISVPEKALEFMEPLILGTVRFSIVAYENAYWSIDVTLIGIDKLVNFV